MRRVELFEQIRGDARAGSSVRSLARMYGVHRRAVRQALASAIPPERKRPDRERPVLTGEVRRFIDGILRADRKAPRKQRHTATRILQRITEELGVRVGASTVRHYVCERRRELGVGAVAFVPQHHPEGAQAEVDFYEAEVLMRGEPIKVAVISMRSEAAGSALHRAYPGATQAAFFDGIARALEFQGGVFPTVRFDNLRAAVARVLRGKRRVEQDRFVAFRSHYGFAASFTTPGIRGAHEKGGVEGEVGRFRRRWFVPVPEVEDHSELNDYLFDCCLSDLGRTITGHHETVGHTAARERELLLPLPSEPFDVAEISRPRVDAKSRVVAKTNRYSVPVRLVGRLVDVRLTPLEVEISHQGQVVARHPRLHLKYAERLELDHYLELLHERPGAFPGSLPLHQERERGTFPPDYEAFWRELQARWGEREGTQAMVDVLLLHRRHPRQVVNQAVAAARSMGAFDPRAVELLVRHLGDTQARTPVGSIEVGELSRYDRPLPDVDGYDVLLQGLGGWSA